MQLKDFLKRKPSIPVRLIRGAFWGMALSYISLQAVQTLPDEEFTDQEQADLTAIFNDSVALDEINYNRSDAGDNILTLFGASGVALGDTVIVGSHLPKGSKFYNYVLRHEIAHIWQKQNCSLPILRSIWDEATHIFYSEQQRYSYTLDDHKDLLDYGHEAQASIIADYYEVKNGRKPYFLNNDISKNERVPLYEATLKNFLQDPKYIQEHCSFNISI